MRSILICALLVAACGERGPRTVGDVRSDSTVPVAAESAVAAPAPSDSLGAQPLAPVGGGEMSGGDTPVSNEPAPAPPAGRDVPAQPAGAATPEPPSNDAAAILRRASAAYENVRSLRAEFVMQYENALLRQKSTSRGTLYQRRPDRIALRFSDPAGDLLIGDGEHFYWYLPSVDAKQVLCVPAAQGGSGGIDLQAQFVGNPVERFHATLHANESVDGRPANVLTLVPRQRAEYRSLKVWLDTRDSLARRFQITEENGTVRLFDLDDMAINPSIPDATFRFTKPANARIAGC